MEPVITSKQNNLVKYIRGLREKRNREQERRFVIEGVKFVSEAVSSGHFPEKIIISERGENNPAVRAIISGLGASQIVRVNDAVMEYMGETDTPQGIMGLVKINGVSLTDLVVTPQSMFAVVEGVQDPGNVGTIIRIADAFGAGGVILSRGCADLYNAKTLRSTMGSLFHVPVVRETDITGIEAFLGRNSVFSAVTSLEENTIPVHEADFKLPLAIIFGNEARGVSPELRRAADIKVRIPMAGEAESLNVATAAGIVFYEAFRQHGSKAKSNL